MDSADVWVHPDLFELDEDLKPIRVAGVPPDYFSPTGQRWGNPLYRWDVLAAIRLRLVDRAHPPRCCHSTTSSASTTSAASRPTGPSPPKKRPPSTANGSKPPAWSSSTRLEARSRPAAPGRRRPRPDHPRGRRAAHRASACPACGCSSSASATGDAHNHLPHRFTPGTVAYTGTHDNDTTLGWWQHGQPRPSAQPSRPTSGRVSRQPRSGRSSAPPHASVAELAIVPAPGPPRARLRSPHEHPSRRPGNWSWRAPEGCLTPALAARLAALVEVTDRDNDPSAKPTRG